MATKSKYQVELDNFKKNLPKIIIETAEDHDLELCEEGLEDLFKRLGVDWERPKVVGSVEIHIEMNLSFDRHGEVTNQSDKVLERLDRGLKIYLKDNFPEFNGYVSIESVEPL